MRQPSCLLLLYCFHYVKLFWHDSTASTKAHLSPSPGDPGTLGGKHGQKREERTKGGNFVWELMQQLIFKQESASPVARSERQQASVFRGRLQVT